MASVISTEAPAEMFRELIEAALAHQRVDSSEDSTVYLVHLLDSFVRQDGRFAAAGTSPDRPLAEVFLQALQPPSERSVAHLHFVGDLALFLVGFYADRLRRAVAGTSCYIHLGQSAYGALARSRTAAGTAALFDELAANFLSFAEVLNEVSENCSLTDASDLLRLYERWEQTGSRRTARLLRAQGVLTASGSNAIH